jgi:hypothetical protein
MHSQERFQYIAKRNDATPVGRECRARLVIASGGLLKRVW